MKPVLGTMTFADQVDKPTAAAMIQVFKSAGYHELDTAFVYQNGATEILLGELQADGLLENCLVAGKINPKNEHGLKPAAIDHQLTTSLSRLNLDSLDLLYLHQPDLDTPVEESLAALFRHYQAGKFKRFGLSNYAAWQVAEIAELCQRNGWMEPVVYQGMYNALTRDVERELFSCLRNYGMEFYIYNPLAGGLLSGKHAGYEQRPDGGRFGSNVEYQGRYWKEENFSAVQRFVDVCQTHQLKPAAAALQWLVHHSALASSTNQHGVILGASQLAHFESNLAACAAGPLPEAVVAALDEGWESVRATCIKYFRP